MLYATAVDMDMVHSALVPSREPAAWSIASCLTASSCCTLDLLQCSLWGHAPHPTLHTLTPCCSQAMTKYRRWRELGHPPSTNFFNGGCFPKDSHQPSQDFLRIALWTEALPAQFSFLLHLSQLSDLHHSLKALPAYSWSFPLSP